MHYRYIFVCSPYRGNILENTKKAKEYCREIAKNGDLPIAPHLYFTQFLDEKNEQEREMGIEYGISLLWHCYEMYVFGDKITEGMKKEIDYAKKMGIGIKYVRDE